MQLWAVLQSRIISMRLWLWAKILDAALAPGPTLLNIKPTFLIQTKVNVKVGAFFASEFL
jgi:hypothetical protein